MLPGLLLRLRRRVQDMFNSVISVPSVANPNLKKYRRTP